MDPWVGLRNIAVDQLWGQNPVHLKKEHYSKLIEGIHITVDKIVPKKRNSTMSGSLTKRGKYEAGPRGSGDGHRRGGNPGRDQQRQN
jgi:hypothetical protein